MLIGNSIDAQSDTMNVDYQKGVKFYNKKEFYKAYFHFNKALEDEPNLAKAYYYKADILVGLNEDSIAIFMLNKAIQNDPNFVEAYYYKAYLNFFNLYNNPLSDISKVIELKPNRADAYLLRSQIYVEIGENSLALNDINKAIEIITNDGYYYYWRGVIKENMNDKIGACKDYAISKKLGFDKINKDDYCNELKKE
jgi:tetratricopeptide (TPR) repeat protein